MDLEIAGGGRYGNPARVSLYCLGQLKLWFSCFYSFKFFSLLEQFLILFPMHLRKNHGGLC